MRSKRQIDVPRNLTRRSLFATSLGLLVAAAMPGRVSAGGDWNDAQVKWMGYEEGIAAAKASKKPVCLVFYTEWCPHCTSYSSVFHDAKVVAESRKFVMIRLDKDKNKVLSDKYKPDGDYIPRTYFLSSAGALEPTLAAPRDKFRYFYDEKDPASILAGMGAAEKKLR